VLSNNSKVEKVLFAFTRCPFISLHFSWVVDDAKCIVVTRVCVSACPSAAACPHYSTDPDVTWGSGRGCPLVVHYWADSKSVHGLRCYGNNANPSYNLASITRYDDIVRTLGGLRALLAGDWPSTGGVLNTTAAAWAACFHWWRSGNITRTQIVSEYMLVYLLYA